MKGVCDTIRRAEQEIRGQMVEAATASQYELVARLSSIALRLSEMVEETAGKPSRTNQVSATRTPDVPLRAPSARPEDPNGRRTSHKRGFPRFERAHDVLVKIGWSKKGRSEYVHKASKSGVDAVARRVMDVGGEGRMFTTLDLLPVKLDSGRDELPGYQTYICLAWLTSIGAVGKHGRKGYSVTATDVMGTVSRAWETLPPSCR